MEPISTTAVFAFINTAFKFSELAVRLHEVGSENEVFVRMIQAVRRDLEETERLLGIASIKRNLSNTPGKSQWIEGAVHSTKSALNEIGRWVERARVDQETSGSVRFETRVRWVFNDHEKLVNRRMELATCHQQLLTVLNYLVPMERDPRMASMSESSLPSYQEATNFDDYISPRQKRKSETTRPGSGIKKSEKLDEIMRGTNPSTGAPITVNMGLLPKSNQQRASTSQLWGVDSDFPPAGRPHSSYTPLQSEVALSSSSAQSSNPSSLSGPSSRRYPGSMTTIEYTLANAAPGPAALRETRPSFCGTNALGPVNPFELWGGDEVYSQPLSRPSLPVSSQEANTLEAPRNPSYFAELPSNEPVEQPAYLKGFPQSPEFGSNLTVDSSQSWKSTGSDLSTLVNTPSQSTWTLSPIMSSRRPSSHPHSSDSSVSTLASPPVSPFCAPTIPRRMVLGSAGAETKVPPNPAASSNRMLRQKALLDMLGSLGHS